ncbi:hypothetical protein [Rubellimicrobium aerolatum]|uniref:Uncharacterized protein n=1 Tax=Rubellimicrobium aerolatum TaxID=490979 RepID=A0ABW0SA93_9RHOB|nr:hypothetical protein [Rubellimicrobium aerolatum]MBP1805211.1 hypothetical protein [Rubellimicrobium aerolatum]
MADPNGTLDKIRSEALRRDAAAADPAIHVVLVEIALPPARLEVARPSAPGRPALRVAPEAGFGTGPETGGLPAADLHPIREAVEAALGHAAERYLRSARAFVVRASGPELRRLAEVPAVRAIWPNARRAAVAEATPGS